MSAHDCEKDLERYAESRLCESEDFGDGRG